MALSGSCIRNTYIHMLEPDYHCTVGCICSEMLHLSVAAALATPEVDWAAPRARDWMGAAGASRVAVFSGLKYVL